MDQRAGEYTSKFWAESPSEERVDGFIFHVWSVVSRPKVALDPFKYLSADRRRDQR